MRTRLERDAVRVAEIGDYRVLTEPPRSDLVALVDIAAEVARVPMATINLITDSEQHQIATHGFDASVCRREDSMCNLVLDAAGPVVVADAREDERFRDNPFVTGHLGRVRFYATHQLVTPNGVVIGTLCVFDEQPRHLSAEQERALAGLADRVVDLLELELRTRELTSSVRELQQARAELERSNESLAAFAGQVSHDLRNPLTAMTMSLRMIDDQLGETEPGSDAEELAWLTQRALSGAGRMQSLVEDLLSYARIGGELSDSDVDLDRTLAEVREDLALALEGAKVEVDGLPTVRGDAVQLRAVLQNLLSNAAKFSGSDEPARIEVRSQRMAEGWRIEVADHGIGIPVEDRQRVLEPFTRVHKTIPGSGIGLSTVQRVVRAHGGRVEISETPGGGTTVSVDLPA